MWFIFPQLRGLGYSWMSERYALDSLAQARRYLAHAVLGRRLIECTLLVLNVPDKTSDAIFGYVDSLKFRSSITLFSMCESSESVFSKALDKYFAGVLDGNTMRLLGLTPKHPQER